MSVFRRILSPSKKKHPFETPLYVEFAFSQKRKYRYANRHEQLNSAMMCYDVLCNV